jgi:hypothetical protein
MGFRAHVALRRRRDPSVVLPALLAVASVGLSLKLIFIPLGILAFLLFLLALGGFGLVSALAIISAITWLFRLLTGSRRRQAREADRSRPAPTPVWHRMPLRK